VAAFNAHTTASPRSACLARVAILVYDRPLSFVLTRSALPSIMLLLLESIVFEDCQNQWSLSRPLMCLIMLQPDQYEQVPPQFLLFPTCVELFQLASSVVLCFMRRPCGLIFVCVAV
jgi:hypothetical protein